MIPGSMAVIAFGVILGIIMKAPMLGFIQGASQNWLLVSLVLILLGSFFPPFFFIPRGKRYDAALFEALEKGEMTPGLRIHINDRAVRFVHIMELIIITVVLILMVFKPF